MTSDRAREVLAAIPGRKVCAVIRTQSEYAEAIYQIAARGQVEWTGAEWDEVLQRLRACAMHVRDWLDLEALIV